MAAIFRYIKVALLFVQVPFSCCVNNTIVRLVLIITVEFICHFIGLRHRGDRRGSLTDRGIVIVNTNESKRVLVGRLGASSGAAVHMYYVVSSGPGGGNHCARKIRVINSEAYVLRTTGGCRVGGVVFSVPSTSTRSGQSVLGVYGRAGYRLIDLPNICRVTGNRELLDGVGPIRVRSLLNQSPVGIGVSRVFSCLSNGIVLIANKNNSVNDRLYERVTTRGPGRLVVFSVCRGGTCSVRRRLGEGCGTLGLGILVKSIESDGHVGSIFRACGPRVICRTTTRGRIPLVRADPGRTVGGGIVNACGATCTTVRGNTRHFILVDASGTIGPAGVVNTDGELYRVIVRDVSTVNGSNEFSLLPSIYTRLATNRSPRYRTVGFGTRGTGSLVTRDIGGRGEDNARFITIHFKGILNDGNSIVPLFGGRVRTNNPMAIARPSVMECFVAVPRTMDLILRTNACTLNNRVFILSVKTPIGVSSLTHGLVELSNCAPSISVGVRCSNLQPNRGLCRRYLVGRRNVGGARDRLVRVNEPVPFSITMFVRGLRGLTTTTFSGDDRVIRVIRGIIPAFRPSNRRPRGTHQRDTPVGDGWVGGTIFIRTFTYHDLI